MDHRTKPGTAVETLQHFGVLGMKWGVRSSGSGKGGGGKTQLQKLKEKEAARKYQAKLDRNAAIDAARARVSSGAWRQDRKAAKAQYKAEKSVIGRKEARRILREKRRTLNSEYNLSQETKHGRETAEAILWAVGAGAIGGTVSAVREHRS